MISINRKLKILVILFVAASIFIAVSTSETSLAAVPDMEWPSSLGPDGAVLPGFDLSATSGSDSLVSHSNHLTAITELELGGY